VKRIKVAHVVSGDLWGGAEAQALSLIYQQRLFADVLLITFNQGELFLRAGSKGLDVVCVDEKDFGIAAIIVKLRKILSDFQPDVVHSHGYKENFLSGISSFYRGYLLVRTFHGRGMLGVNWKNDFIEKVNGIFFSKRIISVSESLKDFILSKGFDRKKISVIHNGIDPAESGIGRLSRLALDLSHEDKVIGIIARLVPVKNHKCLIQAISLEPLSQIRSKLLIIGDGPLRSKLEDYVDELNVRDKVIFLGFKNNVSDFLSILDLFVLASRDEGIPISLLEAMRASIPVVCTKVGGIPEIIEDKITGLLVEPDDSKGMSEACYRMLADKRFSDELARNSKELIYSKFSLSKSVDDTLALYRETI